MLYDILAVGPNLSSSAIESADLRVIVFHRYGWSLTMDTARLKFPTYGLSHGAHWVLVCFSHFVFLLVTCWHLSSSICVPFWFSSGFLSNRLKLLSVTPFMFANSLWQKHGRQLAEGKLCQRRPWWHNHLVLSRTPRRRGTYWYIYIYIYTLNTKCQKIYIV